MSWRENGFRAANGKQSIPFPYMFASSVKETNFTSYFLISNPSYNIVVINFQENHKKLVIS